MSHLKLKSDECSPLGKLILAYVQHNPGVNLSKLAKEMGLSRPGIGWICLKHTSPNEETSAKLAAVLGLKEREVARLVYANKLDNFANPDFLEAASELIDFINRMDFGRRKVLSGDFLVDTAVQNMDRIFEALHHLEESMYPENRRHSDFQVYKRAFEILKTRLEKTFDQKRT